MPFRNPFKANEGEKEEVVAQNNIEAGVGAGEGGGKSQAELLADTITGALKPISDAMGQMNTRMETVEQRFKQRETTATTTQDAPFTSVFEDEDRAIGERVVKVVGPLYQRQMEFEAQINRDQVHQEFVAKGFGWAWDQFAERINTVLDATPLLDNEGKPFRGSKQYIKNTVNMIIGEAATQAGLRFGGKDRGFFLESAGGAGEESGRTTPSDGINDSQRRVFNRMGVSAEDAKKTMARLKFIN